MKILIKNIDLIPVDGENEIIKQTNIGIENNKIVFIGNIPLDFEVDKTIDGYNRLALPGFINSHTHIPMSLLRNYADDLPLMKWLFDKIIPIENRFEADDIYWASMLSISEMLLSGTTCINDMYYMMDEVAKAVQKTGMRAVLGRGITDPFIKRKDWKQEIIEYYDRWQNSAEGRISVSIDPHAIYTCSKDCLQKSIELAKKLGLRLHIHLSESEKEVKDAYDAYGKSPVEYLDELGFFDVPTMAAHCVHLSDKDISILAEKKVNVLHNLRSNFKLGNGFFAMKTLLDHGVNVSLATDGAASNNTQNMFSELSLSALMSKGILKDAEVISASESIKAATMNGAISLGLDHLTGSIEIGKKADIILLDIDKPHFLPHHNLVSAVAYSAQGSDVDTVIVNGKILLEKRKLTTIDQEEVKFNINRRKKIIFNEV